ncbi:MAG: flagellar hook-length control protein FliK [Synergistaceae bacterium]|nr:flagellar hook-length control protein FliK [Synergistaceae bacterium]
MTDIFSLLQTQIQPQTAQAVTPQPQESVPGLFASLITELTAELPEGQEELLITPQESQPVMTFTGNNSFSQGVIDLLAGTEPESDSVEVTPETLPPEAEDSEEVIIWEEVSQPKTKPEQKTQTVTEGSRPEVQVPQGESLTEEGSVPASEILTPNPEIHEEVPESVPAPQEAMTVQAPQEHPEVPASKPKQDSSPVKDSDDDGSDSDDAITTDNAAPEIIALSLAAEGAVQVTHQELPQVQAKTEQASDVLGSPGPRQTQAAHVQLRQARTQKTDSDSPQESQSPSTETRPLTERGTHTALREDTDGGTPEGQSQSQSQNQGQPSTQGHTGSESGNPSTRSRTTTRRADSRTPTERTGSTATTRRTESRTDFQAFFEGVLNTRRTASRTSAAPLSLRGPETFTQSTALRDGLTNVVRFIRADGVQKANVVVDPPALGRISVELTAGTSGVEASIKVASEQIRQLVQDQLSQLRMNLSQQGVQVAEFTVDVQQDNSGSHNPQGQEQPNRGPMNFAGDTEDEDTEEFRVDLEEGLLWWVA